MPPLTAVVLAAAGLAVLAGVQKLRRPAGTAQALRIQGLPSAGPLVRVLGMVEIGIGVTASAGARLGAAALAALYAAFTVFVVAALVRRRPLSSCGCFGRPDTPPTAWHVGVTAGFAAAVAATAATAPAGVPQAVAAGAAGLAVLMGGVVVAGLAYAVLAELAPVLALAARRPVPVAEHPAVFRITVREAPA